MKYEINKRTILLAQYIIRTKSTIRYTAHVFNLSKSTVHNDVSKRLKYIDKELYFKVKLVLDNNFNEKHIRGGMATKKKYLKWLFSD